MQLSVTGLCVWKVGAVPDFRGFPTAMEGVRILHLCVPSSTAMLERAPYENPGEIRQSPPRILVYGGFY